MILGNNNNRYWNVVVVFNFDSCMEKLFEIGMFFNVGYIRFKICVMWLYYCLRIIFFYVLNWIVYYCNKYDLKSVI